MAKIPKIPEEIFPEITGQLKSIFGTNLESVVLYGSGATGGYIPGKSDLNFLVIIHNDGMNNLNRLHDVIGGWRKRQVATPLIMTKSFLKSALDVYPIEFLTMKAHHVLVYGEDILSPLDFDHICLRLQVEREIKGKLLHLRQGYLESEGQAKKLLDLINISLVAFLSLFTAVLALKGKQIPFDRQQLIRDAAEILGIDAEVFLKCLEIKKAATRYDRKDVIPLFDQYLREIVKFDRFIDQLKLEINQ